MKLAGTYYIYLKGSEDGETIQTTSERFTNAADAFKALNRMPSNKRSLFGVWNFIEGYEVEPSRLEEEERRLEI